ncbi:MAG: pentapeptide repeat-containing protein [Flavisolibacter sp.]
MSKDRFDKDLQKMSFRNEDLSQVSFYKSDLRGVAFSGCDLSGTSFINVRTGIRPLHRFWIFFVAILTSVLTGYVSALVGETIQVMLASQDMKIRICAIATIAVIILFIAYAFWKGAVKAMVQLIIPVFLFFIVVGGIDYFSGAGTGKSMLYGFFALPMMVIMLVVGTIVRSTSAKLCNLLFLIVALTGGLVGKNFGGAVGAFTAGISCVLISKRALSGARGFGVMRQIAAFFTVRLGTSFRECKMKEADFSRTKKIHNTDFSQSDLSYIQWGDSQKQNCVV